MSLARCSARKHDFGKRRYVKYIKSLGHTKLYTYRYCRTCQNRKTREARGPGKPHYNRLKRACPHGHPYEGRNLVLKKIHSRGHDYEVRACRACDARRSLESRRRRREAA